tara:strand:+ start:1732 stop:2271 length:540 start_codon:yes stop_codon:yes gene_type:complete
MSEPPVSDAAVTDATGRSWADWKSELDTWGVDLDHAAIARRLKDDFGLAPWWAQTVTGGWEIMTGRRDRHEMPSGFQASASKTIAADPEVVTAAFTEPSVFSGWGPKGRLAVTTSKPGRSVSGRWEGDEGGRVAVHIAHDGAKSRITLSHEKLTNAGDCEALKLAWRSALAVLKDRLES